MRTTKRFTPAVLRRWERNQRSEGTYAAYHPWHQISRDDPASLGQSRIKMSHQAGRQHHLLSKVEFHAYCYLSLISTVKDICEQFRLDPDSGRHELVRYDVVDTTLYSGTVEIAQRMGIKHPQLHANGEQEPWRLTTDFLCLIGEATTQRLFALSVKPSLDELGERDIQLLRLEQEYWTVRNVEWRLITESCFAPRVRLGLSFSQTWALHEHRVSEERMRRDARTLAQYKCLSFAQAIFKIANGDTGAAQRSLMQAAWRGFLPLDFAALTGPEPLVKLLSKTDFDQQNPILCGRFTCL